MLKTITKNITLENVRKSNYWDLIAIIVWNHYSEERYQDESRIEIKESWYGKMKRGASHSYKWDNPEYSEDGYERTLGSINITLKRSDYVVEIYINVETGSVNSFGIYTDKENESEPRFRRNTNMDICNWLISNNFVTSKP